MDMGRPLWHLATARRVLSARGYPLILAVDAIKDELLQELVLSKFVNNGKLFTELNDCTQREGITQPGSESGFSRSLRHPRQTSRTVSLPMSVSDTT